MIAIFTLFTVFSAVYGCLVLQNAATPPPYDAPLPNPEPPTCDCPSQLISDSAEPGYKLNNFYVRGEISDDRCYWQMSCANPRLTQARVNGQLYMSTLFAGQCNVGTKKWSLSSDEGNLWMDVSTFEYACVELL